MNWDALGSIGELVGAIATVITLLYLSLQIKANTLVTKRQSLDDTIERIIRWQARVTTTPEHLRCWVEGTNSFNNLSIEDRIQFTALMVEILASFEATLEAAKTDDVKPETINALRHITIQLFRNKGVREYWEQAIFAGDFMDYIDKLSREAEEISPDEPGNLPFYVHHEL